MSLSDPRISSATGSTECPSGSIGLYDEYFEGDYKRKWYAVGAIAKAHNVLTLCSRLRFDSVADVGAGNGEVLWRLRSAGLAGRYVALEISDSGLSHLRARFKPDEVEIMKFDGYRIPLADDSIDLAILSHVLEHVEHPRSLLHEIRRVARNLCMEVPLEHRALRRGAGLGGPWVPDTTGHINYFDVSTARRLLETSGWRVTASAITNPVLERFQFQSGRLKGLVHWLGREVLLRCAPRIAPGIICYHGCFLAQRAPTVAEALR